MKTLIFLVVIGAVSAAYDVDPAKRAHAVRLMTADLKDLQNCQKDADCASVEGKPKCDESLHLCKPEGDPAFPLETGNCTDDSGCPLRYKCKDSKCHFAGPKICKSDGDCLQGTSSQFECKENPKSLAGKRCFMKCTADADCHVGFPEEGKSKVGCCQGYCQKKAAC